MTTKTVHTITFERRERTFYCRTCGATARAESIPDGWFAVRRYHGDVEREPTRCGCFCRIQCLEKHIPTMKAIEENSGDRRV